MILYTEIRKPKKVYISESKLYTLREGFGLSYDKDSNSFNANIDKSRLDVDNQYADTRLFGTRNDILNGDGSIEKSREGKPGRKGHMFQQQRLGRHYSEVARMYRDAINFVRNFDQSNLKNLYKEFKKSIDLNSYDVDETGPITTIDKTVLAISNGDSFSANLTKLMTNLNKNERLASQYEKPLQNANDERFIKTDKVPRYRVMKVPFTNVNVISLFKMKDFNLSDAIKHGYIRGSDSNVKNFGIDSSSREKNGRSNMPFALSYDNGMAPNVSRNFSLNGSDDLSRSKYGYSDENYTSIAQFVDKSIMGAAYALKCESFHPSVIVDAPSSSKFNLYYCTRLSKKIGVPYEQNFFQRDMINVKMDEESMRRDGVDEKEIIHFSETAKRKGISEIAYFIGEPIDRFFKSYGSYFEGLYGNKIPSERILLVLKELAYATCFSAIGNGDNLLEYFKNNAVLGNANVKFSHEYKTYQKGIHNALYENKDVMNAFLAASKEMIKVFNLYKERLLTTGVKIDFSVKRGKIVDFGGKYRKYLKDMYIVANKNAVNDPHYFERFRGRNYLLFDEDISTGSTLKLLIDALHNNGVNDSHMLCLTNAYSLKE